MMAEGGGGDDDVFVYMGGDQEESRYVTHAIVNRSINIISRNNAFNNRRWLVSIEMHDGIDIIEEDAFVECMSLRSIKLTGVRVIENYAFCACKALEYVEFGNKLETIGDGAFAHTTSLTNIKLPKVRIIGKWAFRWCEQLTDVELSEDLERIGDEAFEGCYRCLRRIAIPLRNNLFGGDNVLKYCDALSQVDLVGEVHNTISSLNLESWRNDMDEEIDSINWDLPNLGTKDPDEKTLEIKRWIDRVLERMEHYKSEHHTLLKEAMPLLELALWKFKLLDETFGEMFVGQEGMRTTRGQRKRARMERRQVARIASGADIVIRNVLPFLKLE